MNKDIYEKIFIIFIQLKLIKLYHKTLQKRIDKSTLINHTHTHFPYIVHQKYTMDLV